MELRALLAEHVGIDEPRVEREKRAVIECLADRHPGVQAVCDDCPLRRAGRDGRGERRDPLSDPLSEATDIPDIDTTTPHSARIYNYWLGGKDNFEVDRAAGDATAAVYPEIRANARSGRAFLGRVVRYLAGEAGVRQFVDIGTGLPTMDNTHQVAQRVAPDARVVYVDNDPLVLAHARALLVSMAVPGSVAYIHQDMNEPDSLAREVVARLDLTQPVAVLFMGVIGHVQVLADAQRLVRVMMDAVPPGSYLALSDGSSAGGDAAERAEQEYAATGAVPYKTRRPAEIESLFDGLEWVEPGFVSVPLWRPDTDPDLPVIGGERQPNDVVGGVARKPGGRWP